MPTMIVLVNLKENVLPQEYERWLEERYVPAILDLASVDEWHGYREGTWRSSRYNASSASSASTPTLRNL